MRIFKSTAKSVKNQLCGIISSPGAWGPKVVTGRGADAIVSRIESHYVLSIMVKPITLERRASAISMHFTAYMNVLWNIITNGQGGSLDVEHNKRSNEEGERTTGNPEEHPQGV